ncbi:BEM_HP_G0080800.mRNA.1.CDS.1 [Saccharomyces cerevisiae]|nr:BEM_HP_G0080800.mRNA.1.CDS.1 [Saccharomyces cerevisiae]CAI6992491.1 BEM_HP_G0080800.mRNA.1.CDS.1 [Saccharomyces cerevisiae]
MITKSLFPLFNQDDDGLRLFAANAYAFGAVSLFTSRELLEDYLNSLLNFYKEKAKPFGIILDQFGLVLCFCSTDSALKENVIILYGTLARRHSKVMQGFTRSFEDCFQLWILLLRIFNENVAPLVFQFKLKLVLITWVT